MARSMHVSRGNGEDHRFTAANSNRQGGLAVCGKMHMVSRPRPHPLCSCGGER